MKEIYFDNAATTKTNIDVAKNAFEIMCGITGNPSSLHKKGLNSQLLISDARKRIANILDCKAEEVFFTSGGTEANNLAILGGAEAMKRRGDNIVVSEFEHSSVIEPIKTLENRGFTIKRIPPLEDGTLNAKAFVDAVDEKTILASCMFINSETGAITDIAELSKAIRAKNKTTLIHCDAVQAFGKITTSARKLGVDLLTASSHKIHAPIGCGLLYKRSGVRILPLLYGGGQEGKLRPGTENIVMITAFGYAAMLAEQGMRQNMRHVKMLCEYFVKKAEKTKGVRINSPGNSTPYIVNISVRGYRSETMLHFLESKGIYVSSGSACAKGAKSHVLTAMKLPADIIDSALRISFCAENTTEEIDEFFAALQDGMDRLVHR